MKRITPQNGLPQDSVLVVRTEALREFEQLISENETEKIQTVTKTRTETREKNDAKKRAGIRRCICRSGKVAG